MCENYSKARDRLPDLCLTCKTYSYPIRRFTEKPRIRGERRGREYNKKLRRPKENYSGNPTWN